MEALFALCFMSCCSMAIPIGALWVVYGVMVPAARDRAQAVGEALGFSRGPAARSAYFWLGTYDGRDAALVPVSLRTGLASQRQLHEFGLRLVLVPACPPSGVVVYRDVKDRGGTDAFEKAFDRGGGADEKLSDGVKQAMLDYVNAHRGALRIRDRADAPAQLLGPDVFKDAGMVVAAEFVDGVANVDRIRARFDAMGRIAAALEASPPADIPPT